MIKKLIDKLKARKLAKTIALIQEEHARTEAIRAAYRKAKGDYFARRWNAVRNSPGNIEL